jgi:hypothetical protein
MVVKSSLTEEMVLSIKIRADRRHPHSRRSRRPGRFAPLRGDGGISVSVDVGLHQNPVRLRLCRTEETEKSGKDLKIKRRAPLDSRQVTRSPFKFVRKLQKGNTLKWGYHHEKESARRKFHPKQRPFRIIIGRVLILWCSNGASKAGAVDCVLMGTYHSAGLDTLVLGYRHCRSQGIY